MESKPKKELVRIVASKEGDVRLDPSGKANGRGAYLCPNTECLAKAKKKNAFSRNLNISVKEQDVMLIEEEINKLSNKET
jgi:predicted RNA-binding protein YlxR (DUF448 family)